MKIKLAKIQPVSGSPEAEAADAAPRATTTSTRAAAADAADATDATGTAGSDECAGADTHVVGFEGARNQVIVVPKKMTVMLWLFCGDESKIKQKTAFFRGRGKEASLLILVSAILSFAGLSIALAHGVDDKRWYWLPVGGGVWLWLVSPTHRALVAPPSSTNPTFFSTRSPPRIC